MKTSPTATRKRSTPPPSTPGNGDDLIFDQCIVTTGHTKATVVYFKDAMGQNISDPLYVLRVEVGFDSKMVAKITVAGSTANLTNPGLILPMIEYGGDLYSTKIIFDKGKGQYLCTANVGALSIVITITDM